MPSPRVTRLRSQGLRYAASLAALVVAGGLTLLVVHFQLPRQVMGYAFLLVIVGSAWWGGYGRASLPPLQHSFSVHT